MKNFLSVLSSSLEGGLRGGLLIFALLATSPLWASYSFQSGNLYYYIKNANEVTVTAANNTHSITIPRTVTYDSITYIVTRIGDVAFYACSSLTSISIPNSITSIGEGAFYRCSSLASINIPNGVTSIGYATFYECSSLTSINIPNSVTSIGEWAFSDCSALTSINIPNGVTSIGRNAFSNCSALTSIHIPNGVTSIEHETFWECSSLSSASIGNSVTSIGENAFWSCSSLTSVNIPNGVTSIKGCAFYRCSALTSITLPNSVTSIDGAFAHCSALTSIHIPDSVTSIGELTFSSCSSLTLVSIPESVTSIGDKAFEGCSSLTSITIPNSVTSIGEYAFYSCSKLTSVTIGESVTSIGDKAFEYCTSLTKTNYTGDIAGWCNIMFGNRYANPMFYSHNFYINDQEIKDLVIPNSVTSIGNYAFFSCSSLTSINIPDSVTSIGDYAFFSCSSLTSINIPNSITSIGDYAFSFCSSLTSITLPDSVTSIGEYAFYYCSSLTSINIPNSITSIGEGTFYGCSSLTSISIPNSVTSIGDDAFSFCSSLTSVSIGNSVTSIGNYAFRSCSSLTSITIPNSVTSIGERAFEYCSSLTSATIGNSVTSIGAEAFYCVNLEEIYCYPTTPPAVTSEPTFLHYNATLYVPCDSKEAYEEHPVFGKFKNIKGIDDCGGGFVTTHIHETICQGEVYEFGEYLCDTTGTYTAIIGDVTTFLYLTVLPSSIDTITVETCDSYEWRGQVYTISGDYTFHGDKEDSIEQCYTEILHLTISKSKYKEETIVSEGSYEWNGKVLTESGDYVSTLKTVNGCDSILELHLKIVPTERENNIIYYTSNSGEVITPYATDVFGANILSNTYENGLGIITFDGPVTQIGHSAFYKTHITSIVLPNTVTSIGHTAFCYCYYLTSIVIPNTVTRIGWSAFSYCYDLTSINIPSSVTFIDEYAFEYCESLTSIEIPEGVKSIKQYTFFGCDRLESVVIPNSVQSIGDYAFFWCSSLNSINLPNKLRTIGEYAFRNCPFTSITIPKSVTKIKDRAFNVCKELVSIVVEDGNTTYDSRNNCNAIIETGTNTLITGCATTTIPDDIVSIADGAFYGCNSLGSITIPNSVTKIGNEAFRCSIDTIYCYAITPPELYDEKVFDEYDANLNVPCSSLEAYKSDSLWGKFTNIQCFETTPPSAPQDTTIYHPTEYATICEGTTFVWMGMEFTAAGMFISEEIVEDENYIYHYIFTLELTVIPFSSDTIVVEAYDSYEWHGKVYTESGTYIYENFCSIEVLELTIIDTPTPPEPPVEPEGPCSNIQELDWKNGLRLSDFSAKTWYKMYVGDVKGSNFEVRWINDEPCVATWTTAYLSECLNTTDWSEIEWESLVTITEILDLDTTCTVSSSFFDNYSQIGDYIYVYIGSKVLDCDSEPQDTTIYHPTKYATICEGDEFYWRGMEFTETGTHTSEEIVKDENYTYHHIYILELTVIPSEKVVLVEEAYDSYEWHGKVYTESGSYTYSDPYNPCVIEELYLTIIDTPTPPEPQDTIFYTYSEYATICEGETYIWRMGMEFTEAGTYRRDEIVEDENYTYHHIYILELTVIPSEKVVLVEEAYDSYEWHGRVYTESGSYTYSDPYNPCVIEELHLTIIDTPTPSEPQDTTIYHPVDITICENDLPYTFTGRESVIELTEAGTYTYEEIVEDENYTYHHIYTLDLTVIAPMILVWPVEAYDSYEWHGVVYTESGVYFYEEYCYQEILELTIIPSEDKEYVYEHHNYLVCDADIFVDPITGSTHVISSLIPFSLTWSDSIIGTNIDTIHTFNITPIVAPEPLTEDILYAIGAVPELVAGEMVNTMGTTEPIMWYYQMNDKDDIADVIGVEWVAGHDVVLDAEQTTHTMVLEVWAQCDYKIPMEFTFPVSKKDSEPQDTTIYIYYTEDTTICEGKTLTWRGMECTETGTYTYAYEEIVEEDDYIYHYHHIFTLDLTVIPSEKVVLVEEAYDSFEWHGIVYTVSGTYTYQYECTTEILHLTIIDTPTSPSEPQDTTIYHPMEQVIICEGDVFEWYSYEFGYYFGSYSDEGTYGYVLIEETEEYIYHHIFTLVLTVEPRQTTIFEVEAEESYEWHGKVYTESGVYQYWMDLCEMEELHLTIVAEPTDLTNPSTEQDTIHKLLRDGQLYIYHNGSAYTIMGQKVSENF